MNLIDLFERHRISALDAIAPYVGQPNTFVTFVDINKLGINPRPVDPTTPVGIYAYPLTKGFYSSMEDRLIPFAGHRDYICLFSASGNIINLQSYTQADLDRDLAALIEMFMSVHANEEYAARMILHYSKDTPLGQNSPAAQMWAATKGFSRRLGLMTNRTHSSVWNGVMRRLGYDGLVDPGMSVIHKIEPSQAVFFSKSPCKTIQMLINDL